MDPYPRIVGPWAAYLPKILHKPTVDLDGWMQNPDGFWWYQYKIHAHVQGHGVVHGIVNNMSGILSYSLDGEPTRLPRYSPNPHKHVMIPETDEIKNHFCMLTIAPGWKVSTVYFRQHFPYPTTLSTEVKK